MPVKSPLRVAVKVPTTDPGAKVTLACLTPPAVNVTLVTLKVAVVVVAPQPTEQDRPTVPAAPPRLVTVRTLLLVC